MSVSGNFSGLSKLVGALQKVAPNAAEIAKKTALKFAPDLANLIRHEFDTGTDPFGDPWKPLKPGTLRQGRHPPPMTASGAAKAALSVIPVAATDRGSLPGYLKYHMQSRPVLPKRRDVWPEAWLNTIRARAAQASNELLKAVGR